MHLAAALVTGAQAAAEVAAGLLTTAHGHLGLGLSGLAPPPDWSARGASPPPKEYGNGRKITHRLLGDNGLRLDGHGLLLGGLVGGRHGDLLGCCGLVVCRKGIVRFGVKASLEREKRQEENIC